MISSPMSSTPEITVIMPVFNGQKYLREAIESILDQNFTNFEFLIINDGSTDDSLDIIKSYQDSRIKLINNEKNLKLIATLNKGLRLATAKYIARMDCDDVSLPGRLKEQYEFMEKHIEVGVCGTWTKLIREGKRERVIKYPTSYNEIKAGLFFKCVIAHPSVMIRRTLLNDHLLSYDTHLLHAEDYNLWIKCADLFPVVNIPRVLLKYRFTSTSTSQSNKGTQRQTQDKIFENNLKKLNAKDVNVETLSYHSGNNTELLIKFEQELLTLINKNKLTHVFDEKEFHKAAGERWFTICYRTTSAGFKAWKQYWSSSLSEKYNIPLEHKLKFLFKCLIKSKD